MSLPFGGRFTYVISIWWQIYPMSFPFDVRLPMSFPFGGKFTYVISIWWQIYLRHFHLVADLSMSFPFGGGFTYVISIWCEIYLNHFCSVVLSEDISSHTACTDLTCNCFSPLTLLDEASRRCSAGRMWLMISIAVSACRLKT